MTTGKVRAKSQLTKAFVASLFSASPSTTQFLVGDYGPVKNFTGAEYTANLAVYNSLPATTTHNCKTKIGSVLHTFTFQRRHSPTLKVNLVLITKTS